MQFSIPVALVSLALATLGLAAPAASPVAADIVPRSPNPEVSESDLSKRTLGLVYICPAYDWQSDGVIGCTHLTYSYSNECMNFSPSTYRYKVSSIGPDPGTWCVLYTEPGCTTGGSDGFSYPGMGRLDGYWATWNDNTGSMKCWW